MFFLSDWLLSHITIVETKDSGKRGMNPVAMTRKNTGRARGSNQRSPVLMSCTLPSELLGLAFTRYHTIPGLNDPKKEGF